MVVVRVFKPELLTKTSLFAKTKFQERGNHCGIRSIRSGREFSYVFLAKRVCTAGSERVCSKATPPTRMVTNHDADVGNCGLASDIIDEITLEGSDESIVSRMNSPERTKWIRPQRSDVRFDHRKWERCEVFLTSNELHDVSITQP